MTVVAASGAILILAPGYDQALLAWAYSAVYLVLAVHRISPSSTELSSRVSVASLPDFSMHRRRHRSVRRDRRQEQHGSESRRAR
ncbi:MULTISPECIES: hypothetical protein [unclassified Streptomyces]|uniref:hypothetical protein n=1 Tax=unclassified Streptomyces TaxID=2593676 RepID=UPI003805C417